MPEQAPGWVAQAPLGAERWRLACIARRGVGMTLATAGFWLAMAGVCAFAGLDAAALGLFFVVGAALVYPAGWLLNRSFGGDLTARGSAFRGLVGAITLAQWLGTPLLVALLLRQTPLVALALSTLLGAHFLPYGWLYRAPAYYVLGIGGAVLGAVLQVLGGAQANLWIALAMAGLYVAAGVAVLAQNRREGVARAVAAAR